MLERPGLTCQLGPTGILAERMQVAPTVSVVPSQTLVSGCWAVLCTRQQMQLCTGAAFHTVSLDQAKLLIRSRAAAVAPVEFQLSAAEMRSPLRTGAWCDFLAATVKSKRRAWLSANI